MSRIFVTGGAGFIGSHLVDRLIAENNEVIVFDNLSTGSLNNLKQHTNNALFRFIKGDLLDLNTLKDCMAGCEVVFHIAAHSDVMEGENNPRID